MAILALRSRRPPAYFATHPPSSGGEVKAPLARKCLAEGHGSGPCSPGGGTFSHRSDASGAVENEVPFCTPQGRSVWLFMMQFTKGEQA